MPKRDRTPQNPKTRSHFTTPKRDRTPQPQNAIALHKSKKRSHSTNPKCDRTPQIQNAIAYSSLVIIASFNSSTVVPNIFATSFNNSSSCVV